MGPALIQPAGLGVVPTILTLQSKGNATDENGHHAVGRYGQCDDVLGRILPEQRSRASTRPRLQGVLTIKLARWQTLELRPLPVCESVFNINENNQLDVLLRELVVTAYDAAGASVFTAALAAPMMLVEIGSGLGTSDYVFGLTADEAAELQAVFSPTLRIGLQASISNAEGGPESFFGGNAEGNPVQVPEPRSLALLGVGLLGIAALVRRRKFKV